MAGQHPSIVRFDLLLYSTTPTLHLLYHSNFLHIISPLSSLPASSLPSRLLPVPPRLLLSSRSPHSSTLSTLLPSSYPSSLLPALFPFSPHLPSFLVPFPFFVPSTTTTTTADVAVATAAAAAAASAP